MKKEEAISLFNGVNNMAEALGVTRQTIHGWNQTLTQGQADRVRGAFMRIESNPTEEEQEILNKAFVRTYSGKAMRVE